MAEALVSIGTFSILTGLSVPALRHYADLGLLVPADVDPRTGYRRYSRSQVTRARRIRALRLVEPPLEEVRRVIDGEASAARAVLKAHMSRLADYARELQRKTALVESYLRKGIEMQGVAGVRLVALNLGVPLRISSRQPRDSGRHCSAPTSRTGAKAASRCDLEMETTSICSTSESGTPRSLSLATPLHSGSWSTMWTTFTGGRLLPAPRSTSHLPTGRACQGTLGSRTQ